MIRAYAYTRSKGEMAEPGESVEVATRERTIRLPPYHVVLLDDDEHICEYVIEMLVILVGHSPQEAYELALAVDTAGRLIVDTTTRERAELKRDQIRAYGPDPRIGQSKNSMGAEASFTAVSEARVTTFPLKRRIS